MSENTVTIDADRLLQWGIDAYERGRASVLTEWTPPLVSEPAPWPTVTRCRVVLLGGGNTARPLFDTQWPSSGPCNVSLLLSNGASYRGTFT